MLDDWALPSMDLCVIYPSGRLTSTKARAFVEWLEDVLNRAGWLGGDARTSRPDCLRFHG